MFRRLKTWGLPCVLLASAGAASALTLPKGFSGKQVAQGLSSPSALTVARDGRVFIAQQQGQVRLLKNDTLLAKPFLTLSNIDGSQERGLLGIALDPGFDTNHYVYVYYTASQPTLHNQLSRFKAVGDTADRSTDTVLLSLPTLPNRSGNTPAYWHMGGGIEFGPDGKLYIGVGDHESPNSDSDLASPFGKVLRVDPNGSVPSDNPYADSLAGLSRYIFARGFRNPFTIAVQRSTGRVFANDVGDGTWESVDSVVRKGHYGWRTYEGNASASGFINPLHLYEHRNGDYPGCAVIGGAFYEPDSVRFAAADTGKYFFTDFCEGWIKKTHPVTGMTQIFAEGLSYPTGLKFDRSGNLYVISRGYQTGSIRAGESSAWKITGGGDTTTVKDTTGIDTIPKDTSVVGLRPSLRSKIRARLESVPAGSWKVPEGVTGLRVHDLSGRLLWEARGLVPGSRLRAPEALAGRVAWILWSPDRSPAAGAKER